MHFYFDWFFFVSALSGPAFLAHSQHSMFRFICHYGQRVARQFLCSSGLCLLFVLVWVPRLPQCDHLFLMIVFAVT